MDTGVERITRIVTGTINEGQQVGSLPGPAPEVAPRALVAEIGRREVDEVAFVLADDEGAIVAPTGHFTCQATQPITCLSVCVLISSTRLTPQSVSKVCSSGP